MGPLSHAVLALLAVLPTVAAAPIRKGPDGPPGAMAVPERNMVNLQVRGLPTEWSIETDKRKNVKWSADVGHRTFGSPVVAHGRVFVPTTNAKPRDPKLTKKMPVLMAFDERDGKFLWQIAHDIPDVPVYCPGSSHLLMATPTLDDRKLYYLTPLCEVICADAIDGKILWRNDLGKKFKITPLFRCACSPLVVADLVFIVTGHGDDANDFGDAAPAKGVPSFAALNKHNGAIVWTSSLPGADIIGGQWANSTYAIVDGTPQVIFGGGNGVLYSFEPKTGRLIWRCDCLPVRRPLHASPADNTIVGTPVVVGNRVYVGLGGQHDGKHLFTPRHSYFLCIDIRKKGDVSLKSYDAKAAENKNSALIWAFGGPIPAPPAKGRNVYFGATMSTAAVHDGLVYISERDGYLHCLDAGSGQRHWIHDLRSGVIGSPYLADGKVYLSSEDGEVWIFEAGKNAKLIARIEMEDTMWTSPTAANGTLYVLTHSKLHAIANPKPKR